MISSRGRASGAGEASFPPNPPQPPLSGGLFQQPRLRPPQTANASFLTLSSRRRRRIEGRGKSNASRWARGHPSIRGFTATQDEAERAFSTTRSATPTVPSLRAGETSAHHNSFRSRAISSVGRSRKSARSAKTSVIPTRRPSDQLSSNPEKANTRKPNDKTVVVVHSA